VLRLTALVHIPDKCDWQGQDEKISQEGENFSGWKQDVGHDKRPRPRLISVGERSVDAPTRKRVIVPICPQWVANRACIAKVVMSRMAMAAIVMYTLNLDLLRRSSSVNQN